MGLAGLCFAFLLCGPTEVKHELQKVKAVRIGYMVTKERKYVSVSNRQEVKTIISQISIEEVEKGTQVGKIPNATVDFILADNNVLETFFVSSTQLDRANWGQIYLNNTKFYEKINEIVSKTEGKKIDVLENN